MGSRDKPDRPIIHQSLIDYLDYHYRDEYPTDPNCPLPVIYSRMGQFEIIRLLKRLRAEQVKQSLLGSA